MEKGKPPPIVITAHYGLSRNNFLYIIREIKDMFDFDFEFNIFENTLEITGRDEKEKPIGIQILGPHAGDLLAEWVAVLNGKVKLSTIAAAVHPYPTIAEINKKVTGTYFSTKIFSDKIKKGLKFFFHLKGRACVPNKI